MGTPDTTTNPNHPKLKYPDLWKQFEAFQADAAAIEAKTAPLHEQRAAIRRQMAPLEAQERALNKQIRVIESGHPDGAVPPLEDGTPQHGKLFELKQQIAGLARIFGAKTMSQPADPAAEPAAE